MAGDRRTPTYFAGKTPRVTIPIPRRFKLEL
jgi:hypothetical protein